MSIIRKLIHLIAHLAGWNRGMVETWWEDKKLMVGFRCDCGELMGVHESHNDLNYIKRVVYGNDRTR
jgi:hypothetical protein